jgi:hypothetical protein
LNKFPEKFHSEKFFLFPLQISKAPHFSVFLFWMPQPGVPEIEWCGGYCLSVESVRSRIRRPAVRDQATVHESLKTSSDEVMISYSILKNGLVGSNNIFMVVAISFVPGTELAALRYSASRLCSRIPDGGAPQSARFFPIPTAVF